MVQPSWNDLIAQFPLTHILQSQEWGNVKSKFGWNPQQMVWIKQGSNYKFSKFTHGMANNPQPAATAQILNRSITIGGFSARMRVIYVPKGPLLDWNNPILRNHVINDLNQYAKQQGAIFLKIDPDIVLGTGIPNTPQAEENSVGSAVIAILKEKGFLLSGEQVQFRNTVTIDLKPTEEELLDNMKQKTRYNTRLAERKGVKVRLGTEQDIPLLYRMYAQTSIRDHFVIRSPDYYELTWSTFINAGLAEALIAEVDGEPIAAIIVFRFARKSWYFYGMSTDRHREKMPNYLLQWEAIKRAKNAGCYEYDLWGAPDQFIEEDPLWNVYRFKEGLGGDVIRHIGAWDLPVKPFLYRLYTRILPGIMERMRFQGRRKTHQSIVGN